MNYKESNRCQISNSKNLKLILSLGLIPPVNQMSSIKNKPKEQFFFPTEIYYCKESKLVQLGIEVNKKILFPKEYPYTSSTTKILRENFKQLASEVFRKFNFKKEDLIIDIGSNDGNLLSNFKNKIRVLGITPEDIGKIAIKKGIPTILDYFSLNLTKKILSNYGKANFITATNVFAHIENVNDIMLAIKKIMEPNGIFINESHYLKSLVDQNQFDTIYHEHLRYYSLTSLNYLFKMHNMEIINAKKIRTHGGSIRVYAAFKGKYKINSTVKKLLQIEKNTLFKKDLFLFSNKVIQSKLNFYKLIRKIKKINTKIYGISAPSRATTLINYFGLRSDIIDCILEIEGSKKINKYLPGTDIPIYNEKKLYIDQPEYVVIFSWHIHKEIIKNLQKKGYKGKFILPLPQAKIIT